MNKNKNRGKITQRRTVGNVLPITQPVERQFITENKSFEAILTPEDQKAINKFIEKDPFKHFADLGKYHLNKPLVTAEEQKVIDNFYQAQTTSHNDDKAWIQTFSGRKFYPLNPHIDAIVIQDIAHALSLLCRYTGHVREFYSIAQHCVLVSYLCDTADQLYGLLHDASEAYLVDVPTPLKRTPQFAFYKEAEHHLQNMIYKRFGLQEQEPPSVKRADILMLATEAVDLLQPLHAEWKLPTTPLSVKINPLSPKEAETLFLNRFNELFIKNLP